MTIKTLITIALGTLLVAAVACNRQSSDVRERQHPITHMNYGEIGGRVVATATPASGQAAPGEQQPASGATLVLLDLAAGRQYLETLQKSQEKTCTERLAGMQSALTQFARAGQGGKGALTVQADQDGYFVFDHLAAGAYLVVAEGHVGTTDAIWTQPTEVPQDKATIVKLAQPLVACPVSGASQQPAP
ncbi:MAG TPA: hypothetical protein VGW33_13200 [Terriglobia bacterium]|nr:hypothetical protein [Terriglobia bacterium]